MNALQVARYVYRTEGMRGFYRGLTASYAGISETMICFLIYETLKKRLAEGRYNSPNGSSEKVASDFLGLMLAAAFSKGCASCIAYPHGKQLMNGSTSSSSKNIYFLRMNIAQINRWPNCLSSYPKTSTRYPAMPLKNESSDVSIFEYMADWFLNIAHPSFKYAWG